MVFLVLRESQFTCQGLILADIKAGVSKQMLKYAASLPKESIVDVKATIVKDSVQIFLENPAQILYTSWRTRNSKSKLILNYYVG